MGYGMPGNSPGLSGIDFKIKKPTTFRTCCVRAYVVLTNLLSIPAEQLVVQTNDSITSKAIMFKLFAAEDYRLYQKFNIFSS